MKNILRILSYLKPYWFFQLLFICSTLGYFGGELALPWISTRGLNELQGKLKT